MGARTEMKRFRMGTMNPSEMEGTNPRRNASSLDEELAFRRAVDCKTRVRLLIEVKRDGVVTRLTELNHKVVPRRIPVSKTGALWQSGEERWRRWMEGP